GPLEEQPAFDGEVPVGPVHARPAVSIAPIAGDGWPFGQRVLPSGRPARPRGMVTEGGARPPIDFVIGRPCDPGAALAAAAGGGFGRLILLGPPDFVDRRGVPAGAGPLPYR